jgi:hypothetical protein
MLRWIFSIAFHVGAVVTVVVVVVSIMSTYPAEESELVSSWPVFISPQALDYKISPLHQNLYGLSITSTHAMIRFASTDYFCYALKLFDLIARVGLWLFVLYFLKELFTSLATNYLFTEKNIKMLRMVAVLIILIMPMKLINGLFHYIYFKNNVHVEGKTVILFPDFFTKSQLTNDEIWFAINPDFHTLVIGLVILVLVEIFRIGLDFSVTMNQSSNEIYPIQGIDGPFTF